MGTKYSLVVRDLETRFFTRRGVVQAVNGVSFEIAPGERMAIVGESGSGKTAMALSLLRLIPHPGKIVAGSVELNGRDLLQLSERDLCQVRGNDVGMVFQDPMTSLNPVMRVRDQMSPLMQRHLGMDTKAAMDRAVDLLRQVGIPDPESRVDSFPHELSGGMRQRVLIAMALSCRPDLIIADEPTTALDVTIQAQIVSLLKGLSEETGTAVLFVTHDFGLVARFAHKVAVMYGGRIVEYGPTRELFANPQHPYTRGLLSSIPTINGPKPERLQQIEGSPPEMRALGSGCSFMPRCPVALGKCATERPDLEERSADHSVACWAEPAVVKAQTVERVGVH